MIKNIVLLFALGMGISSCGDPTVYHQDTQVVEDQSWGSTDTMSFEFEISDSEQHYDFYLDLRTTTSYGYSNFWAFVKLENEDRISFDTINVPLADPSGHWFGDASASMVENHILFMKNARMDRVGKYKISFVHAMRDHELADVSDVGLTIKTAMK